MAVLRASLVLGRVPGVLEADRQHPGVMSLKPRIKREIANLRRRQYALMREEAGLAGALKCAHASSEGSKCGKNETHAGLRLGRQAGRRKEERPG